MCINGKSFRQKSNYPLLYKLRHFSISNDNFDKLFRFSPDGILIVGRDGRIFKANPAIYWMLGIEDERTLDTSFNIFHYLDEDDQENCASSLDMVITGLVSSTRLEVKFNRRDGTSFYADIAIGTFSESNNPTAQIIIHDITEYHLAEDNSLQIHMELEMSYTATLNGWSRALELRDRETQGHSLRVTEKTIDIALRVGISIEKIIHVRHGALLHDIGKMAIPDSILFKPGPLSIYERNVVEQHPTFAFNLLNPIKYLLPALTIPYSHHEKFDGSGYPQGIRGENIPIEARIFSVVDVWDSLLADKPYRTAWPEDKIKQYIWENRGTQFDPAIVSEFLDTV
jgi:PAS domain S-box-containing protein